MIMKPRSEREVNALRVYQEKSQYCEHPLHINIWSRVRHPWLVKVSHAFYMNDQRDLDPFYLEYDR